MLFVLSRTFRDPQNLSSALPYSIKNSDYATGVMISQGPCTSIQLLFCITEFGQVCRFLPVELF